MMGQFLGLHCMNDSIKNGFVNNDYILTMIVLMEKMIVYDYEVIDIDPSH